MNSRKIGVSKEKTKHRKRGKIPKRKLTIV